MDNLFQTMPVETILWVLAVLGVLKSISTFLDFLASRTKNTTDDKIAKGFNSVLKIGSWFVDLITANTKPKDK